jgi:hypothetical protein
MLFADIGYVLTKGGIYEHLNGSAKCAEKAKISLSTSIKFSVN